MRFKPETRRACSVCGTEFYANPTRIATGKPLFCSQRCYHSTRSERRRNSVEHFWSLYDKHTDCWIWTGGRDTDGYGKYNLHGTVWVASRLAYTLAYGPVPPDKYVCHTCDNPPCGNPPHLFLGTNRDNMRDAASKGRIAVGQRNGNSRAARAAR